MEISEGNNENSDKWNDFKRNCHTKCQRYRFVIGSVVVALVLLIVVTVIVTKNRDSHLPENSSQQLHSNRYTPINDYEENNPNLDLNLQGKLVLLIDGKKLVSFDYKSLNMSLLFRGSNHSTINAFDVHISKYIYRSEKLLGLDEKYIVASISSNKSDMIFLLDELGFKPIAITVDRITGQLYFIDKDNKKLVVSSLHTRFHFVLLADLIEPRELALDPEDGVMFVLQFCDSILRANMDGSEFQIIITNDKVTSMAIDSNQKRLYWIDNFSSIQSTDYEGKNQQLFFNDIMRMEKLTVLDNQLFWTWSSFQNATNFFSCEISKNYTCENHLTYNVIGNVTSIHGYSTVDTNDNNPCEMNDCEQMCLINGRNSSVCECAMGWYLKMDQHSCTQESLDKDIVMSWWKPS